MMRGAAGTGKTTLLSEFLKILKQRKRPYTLMAPTGRAAYIIGSKTGVQAHTIHKTIFTLASMKARGESENSLGFHSHFGLRKNSDPEDMVYLVDEASMISDLESEDEELSFGSGCLLSDFFKFAGSRKVVFVGDYAQLPPVGMDFSPALDCEYISEKFKCRCTEITLREVMRQKTDGVVLANATRVRNNIENKDFTNFLIEDGPDSFSENSNLIGAYINGSPATPNTKAVIIAHSNRQVAHYNVSVRRHYFGEGAPALVPGELLMISRNNYAYDVELFNGNIVKVTECAPESETIVRTVKVENRRGRMEPVELRFRKATISFKSPAGKVSLSVTLLANFLDDPSGAVDGLLGQALMVEFETRLPIEIRQQLKVIKKALKSKRKPKLEVQQLCDKYLSLLQVDPFFNSVFCKYGYAVTCHKAQGGEWSDVYIDMTRNSPVTNEDYYRWAYTALTRASNRVWHYRSPNFKF